MKKRIRKKRHLGEFAHYGIGLKLSVQESNAEEVYDKVIDIAERNGQIQCLSHYKEASRTK